MSFDGMRGAEVSMNKRGAESDPFRRTEQLSARLRDSESIEAQRFVSSLDNALVDQESADRAVANLGILDRVLNMTDLPDLPVAIAELVEQPGGRRKLEKLLAAKPDKANELVSELLEDIQQLQVDTAEEDFQATG